MKHVRRITSLPAVAFGEVRPNLFVKSLEILLQAVPFILNNKNFGNETPES